MDIVFDRVTKSYASGKVALHALDLTIPSGSIFCLLGTSGSGKTTTLKLINRLHEPTSGQVRLGGRNILEEDPIQLRRSIGYVIQGGGLFPHLTIEGNMSLVGRLLGWSRTRLDERLDQLFTLFGFSRAELGPRYPSELSGGQNQRVGVARALLADPPVLLMDEPFSALDPVTRSAVQDELLRIQQKIAKTIVMVTHDLDECFRLADGVALMDAGRLEQVGHARDLILRPASPFVESFVAGHGPGHGAKVEDCLDERVPVLRPGGEDGATRSFREVPTLDASGRYLGRTVAGAPVESAGPRLTVGDPLPAALRMLVQEESPWIPVLEADGRYRGAITARSALARELAGGTEGGAR